MKAVDALQLTGDEGGALARIMQRVVIERRSLRSADASEEAA